MLRIEGLTYRIGGRAIIDGASLTVPTGHRAALVGRNGGGKTTLLRLITGELHGESGDIVMAPNMRIGTVAQTAPSGGQSPLDFVLASDGERVALLAEAEKLESEAEPDGARLATVHERLVAIGAHAAPARAASILHGLGLNAKSQSQPLSALSGGWRMRVALAAALFAQPDLLLLDEPTNHLDLEASFWLAAYLAKWPRTLLLASHDRALINRVAGETIHLDGGRTRTYRGGFDAFLRARREAREREAAVQANLAARRKHMQAFVDRFRYQANKARQAQSRLKALERLGEPEAPVADTEVVFTFPEPSGLAPPLLVLEDTAAGYGDTPILEGLNLRIDMDDRIALLGANGNGKTTLMRLLADHLPAIAGERRRSRKLTVGYYAQDQEDILAADRTAEQYVAERLPDANETARRAHLGRFGLSGPLAAQPVKTLSGGERVRLVLALVCCDAPHLLLLDEPTNHLDIDAREALVEGLNGYSGAVVLITHDRRLIELCAERLWLVADGTCRAYDGDLDSYEKSLMERRRGKSEGKSRPSANRAERRRDAARRRDEIAPLRKAAAAAERKLESLAEKRSAIVAAIADPLLYEGEGSAERVAALGQEKVQLERAMAEAEVAWLEAQEALEEADTA
ncbi:MAG: ABC-F family ATP-binding cassette domain-containing protein [Alphaproteobacteria bacterium]|nr:ABC-F family ATP-binding cassette domain-containing protein [Alphaproteobacteria bacterium]